MALVSNNQQQLPCGGDGRCMICHVIPSDQDRLTCTTCATPWHATCLSSSALADTLRWECPDCTIVPTASLVIPARREAGDLMAKIRAIEADQSLSDQDKAIRRQELLTGKVDKNKYKEENDDINCQICIQLLERPVTTPCGHNFCLKCFQKWVAQGKRNCATCRGKIPAKMASQPRINDTVVAAIRMLKARQCSTSAPPQRVYRCLENDKRPDKAFTTERAKRNGKANAASGRIFVTVAPDHFGPILPEHDPERNLGVMVGETWEDRMECRQWGSHRPQISGIAGQSAHGAQSVVLSGGYMDDEDHGEWFLYTGSGGKDLKGNKRTNKDHSFDQKFSSKNEALRVSCLNGYPVRVIRSYKEKRSSYAPVKGVRYDGIYRIETCWRKAGVQGFKVCRYLFVRSDNAPAPWTSDSQGDRPRPLPVIPEMDTAEDLTQRMASPSWEFDEEEGTWKWSRPPPPSKQSWDDSEDYVPKRRPKIQAKSIKKQLLRGFMCTICREVLTMPVTTPCAHNFCKACLEDVFEGKSRLRERIGVGGRSLRAQKNILKCPACPMDISDYLQDPHVNRELTEAIESLKSQAMAAVNGDDDEAEEEEPSDHDANGEDEDMNNPPNCQTHNKRKKVSSMVVPPAPKRRGRPPKNQGAAVGVEPIPDHTQSSSMLGTHKQNGSADNEDVHPIA